jgi:hypothetical protein
VEGSTAVARLNRTNIPFPILSYVAYCGDIVLIGMLGTFFGMGIFTIPLAVPFWLASFLAGILSCYFYSKVSTSFSISLYAIYVPLFILLPFLFGFPWWLSIIMLGISQWRLKERLYEDESDFEWNLGLLILMVALTLIMYKLQYVYGTLTGDHAYFFVNPNWALSGLLLYLLVHSSLPFIYLFSKDTKDTSKKKSLLLLLLCLVCPVAVFTLFFAIGKGISSAFKMILTGFVYLFSWLVNPIFSFLHFLQSKLSKFLAVNSESEKMKNEKIGQDPLKEIASAHGFHSLDWVISVLIIICVVIALYLIFRKKRMRIEDGLISQVQSTREKINMHAPILNDRIHYSAAESRVRLAVQSLEKEFGSTSSKRKTAETFNEWMIRLSFQQQIDVKLYDQIRYGKVEPLESQVIKFEEDSIKIKESLK